MRKKNNYSFFHSSSRFNNLLKGQLIYFSSRIEYSLVKIPNLDFMSKGHTCCSYDENTPIYEFKNNKKLRLFVIPSELDLNFLQLKYGNQKLIYFLEKNNLDGFVTDVSIKKIKNIRIYLLFIKDSNDFEIISKYNNKGELDYLKDEKFKRLIYYIYIFLVYSMKYYLLEYNNSHLVKDNINLNEKLDYLYFIKKFNFDNKEINKSINKIRIASYNVHYFRDFYNNYTFDRFYNFVSKLNIDVLCLQEVVTPRKFYENIYLADINNIIDNLRNLNYKYFIFDKESFLFVASKLKIYNKKIISLNDYIDKKIEPRKVINFDIVYNNKFLNISNLHLHTDTNIYKKCNQEEENIRLLQVKKLVNILKNKNSSIILGDFNSLTDNDYSKKRKEYMITYNYIHTPKTNLVTKFLENNNFKDSYNKKEQLFTSIHKRRVDYILTKGNIKLNYYNTSNFRISDHSLIFVDI